MFWLVVCYSVMAMWSKLGIEATSFMPNPLPAYCNSDYSSYSIAPMTTDEINQVSRIKQLQVMIRHGSRTPYAAGLACWEGYDVQWSNCNVTELMLPSDALYNYSSQSRPEKWLFRLIYDAWPNELGGNCMTGQLMHEGYLQEEANGAALAELYLNNPNPSLNIFSTANFNDIDQAQLYLRSDDEQRVLMSGQIMLAKFFDATEENIVEWHTMDDAIDQIAPNTAACPALKGASTAAYASNNFTSENTSTTAQQLASNLSAVWGEGQWSYYNAMDCIMTTVCTGRGIPSNPETGEEMTQALMMEAIDQATYIYTYQALHNNSWYSKLGMSQTTYKMRTYLEGAVNNDADAIKFGLWSAHDTSIMPFLAALLGWDWDQQWARYAAMVTIELYENANSGSSDLFRLTYNGKALPMPGCNGATLCDVNVLLDLMSFAVENNPDCLDTSSMASDDDGTGGSSNSSSEDATIDGIDLAGWVGLCLMSGGLGLFLGALIMYLANRGKSSSDSDMDNDKSRNNGGINPVHIVNSA